MATVRQESPADHQAIREIHEEAFGRAVEARLADALRASSAFVPELSLVAERDGRVVGHALFSRATLVGDEPVELLALGPIAVRPECQRQGIGGALIRAGLERAEAMGFRAVVLVGHPTYYPRFGFTPARAAGLETTFAVSDEAFMVCPLPPRGLEGVRGTVRFAPAFDAV
jgi:putative acetyltransferase